MLYLGILVVGLASLVLVKAKNSSSLMDPLVVTRCKTGTIVTPSSAVLIETCASSW